MQPFLHAQRRGRQHTGDPLPRIAIAVQMVRRISAVRDLPPDRLDDLRAVVGDVDDVEATIAAALPLPTLTVGTPMNAPSRRGALELPTAHAQLFISRT